MASFNIGNWFEQNAPAATGAPVPGASDPLGGGLRPQVQDPWGRSPSNPNYNKPPGPGEVVDIPNPNRGPNGSYTGGYDPSRTVPGSAENPQGTTLGGGPPRTYAEAQEAFNRLFPGETLTPQMLQEHEAELNALGFQLRPNAQGVVGKIQWGNEPIVDVIQGAGSGLNRKQWLPGAPIGTGGAAGGGPGAFGYMVEPWKDPFKARDPNEIMQDPAYQFQLKEGLRGITSGAAAKGTLLTGGTLKALEGYGQGLASTYNDKYYNRDLGEYGIRRENFYANQDRPFDKFFKAGQLGKPNP